MILAQKARTSIGTTPMYDHDQVRPLAVPSPDPATLAAARDAERQSKPRYTRHIRRRQWILCGCGCAGVIFLLLGIIVLILALIFKIKDPVLRMNSIHASDLRKIGNSSDISLTLIADLSIDNPNDAEFKFGNSTVLFFYKGNTTAVGSVNGGKVGRDREQRMNVTVAVVTTTNVSEVAAGKIEITSYSELEGTVNVLGIYKRDKTIMLNCTMWPDLGKADQDLNNSCVSRTR